MCLYVICFLNCPLCTKAHCAYGINRYSHPLPDTVKHTNTFLTHSAMLYWSWAHTHSSQTSLSHTSWISQLSWHQVAPADIVEHNRISLSKCDTPASPDGASTSQLVSRFVKYLLRMMVHEEYMRTVEQCFTASLLCKTLQGKTAARLADKVFTGLPGVKRYETICPIISGILFSYSKEKERYSYAYLGKKAFYLLCVYRDITLSRFQMHDASYI